MMLLELRHALWKIFRVANSYNNLRTNITIVSPLETNTYSW
ncbi:MAG: hypothetical protein ACJAZF_003449 [Granulosicoccus sp.]|jgi:hypothetical protein